VLRLSTHWQRPRGESVAVVVGRAGSQDTPGEQGLHAIVPYAEQ
jgi:hypothetical protein